MGDTDYDQTILSFAVVINTCYAHSDFLSLFFGVDGNF
jgi:hypothetical protein